MTEHWPQVAPPKRLRNVDASNHTQIFDGATAQLDTVFQGRGERVFSRGQTFGVPAGLRTGAAAPVATRVGPAHA